MTEICVALMGILFPVVFWTAYKVGKIESGLEHVKRKVDTILKNGR